MDPQLISWLIGAGGGGGLLAIAIKRTWSDRDAVNDAFAQGRRSTVSEYREQLDALRGEFAEQRDLDNARYQAEIRRVEFHVQRLHDAIAQLVPLVPAQHMADAVRILATLSIATPQHPSKESKP